MKAFFARASTMSYLVGLVLCVVHLVFAWRTIIAVGSRAPDAQWQLVWVYFLPFDFPFSLVVLFSGILFPDWSFRSLPYPVSEFRGFILPAFIHGVIGPLWYFFLPISISSLRAYFRNKEREKQKG